MEDSLKKLAKLISVTEFSLSETQISLDTVFFPNVVQVIQKDPAFFCSTKMIFGVDIAEIWRNSEDSKQEEIWTAIQSCMLASFTSGNIKEKISSVLNITKDLWKGKDDEISKVLNDESSGKNIENLIEFVTNTRIAKLFVKIVEDVGVDDLNIENPEELLKILKNPEHPVIMKIMEKVKSIIESKIKKGEISQKQITTEIEAIKTKVMALFGDAFNDILGTKKEHTESKVLLSNTPEARRQRMMARLQKKVQQKNLQ